MKETREKWNDSVKLCKKNLKLINEYVSEIKIHIYCMNKEMRRVLK